MAPFLLRYRFAPSAAVLNEAKGLGGNGSNR
jgi:hypothetical protein